MGLQPEVGVDRRHLTRAGVRVRVKVRVGVWAGAGAGAGKGGGAGVGGWGWRVWLAALRGHRDEEH